MSSFQLQCLTFQKVLDTPVSEREASSWTTTHLAASCLLVPLPLIRSCSLLFAEFPWFKSKSLVFFLCRQEERYTLITSTTSCWVELFTLVLGDKIHFYKQYEKNADNLMSDLNN